MNQLDLNQRVAVITGGTGGIGKAIATRFVASGAKVILWDRQPDALSAVVAETGSAAGDVVDVTDQASLARAAAGVAEQFGGIDILINAAGINGAIGPVESYPVESWHQVMAVNLTGVFLSCREVLPYLRRARHGRIVNLSSVGGKEGNPNQGAYGASKAGVIALTKSLGKELADTDIRVNAVAPAAIESEMLAKMTEEQRAFVLAKIPMGRAGRPDEVAAMVAWLATEECSFTTGATLDLTGGRATY
ncbi:3-oxoacyl-[acyl-carrier protein] reductase [Comamonas sp. BIGb0124]|uniref:SDR family NAD(P)-dependent oxidoreductase n=1 Tax=Comamonas sp. BIGb0124 TaxID=2485130 RepID=UPI000F49C1AE|nr:SDR family NAD(P)-dependent oxidoreductase [Comamonas sp. BIGb0124]ROR21474.1 3-oxoacyl-[acyl-carrier protein] reductase [Comamonas sp. BIGb0124]